ncbi:MAG: glycosyltransferase [Candidatus Liptonbacteria bacterium]|nr:glycosyltransferase [Candidatus Liptonbacteria bacterium]
MRIAIYSDNFYPELSGITDSIITTGKELARRGHFINYYVPCYSKENYLSLHRERKLDLGPRIEVHRLPAFPIPTGTGQGRFAPPIMWSFPSLKKFNPDVIHLHLLGGTGFEALIASRILRKPLVGTNHTVFAEFLHYFPVRAKLLDKLILGYDSWLYNRCDFVASPTHTIFDAMASFDLRILHEIISNPIDSNLFNPHFSKAEMKKKFTLSEFTILYVGRLAAEKSISVILRAIALLKNRIPNLNLALVGRGAYEAELRDLAKSLGIVNMVKFMGFIPQNIEMVEIYNACDIFTIMSTSETQNIGSMQALACKLPVIAADAWGLKDYINPDVGFRIAPGDSNALAEKIFDLYKRPEKRAAIGAEGRKYVKQFSIENVGGKWEEIYGGVIKRYNQKAAR